MPATPYRTEFGVGWISRDETGSLTKIELPGTGASRDDVSQDPLVDPMEQFFAGNASMLASEELVLMASNTALQEAIYRVVSQIRPGHTMSYAEVATAAGRPGAARAVGAAMAWNPYPPVIPCHRVVASDGSLAGYAGGLGMKAALLEMERHG